MIVIELLLFKYSGENHLSNHVQVGAASFGDLEVLMEPHKGDASLVIVNSEFNTFYGTWDSILNKVFSYTNIAAYIEINDYGATPDVITMRLLQALKLSCCEDNSI